MEDPKNCNEYYDKAIASYISQGDNDKAEEMKEMKKNFNTKEMNDFQIENDEDE